MKNKIIQNKNIVIITLIIVFFLIVLKDVFQYEVTSYDKWAYSVFVEDFRSDEMTLIMKMITACGGIIILGLIVLLFLILYKNKKIIYLWVMNTVFIVIINDFLKFIIKRPRPNGYNLINESNYSFPSGHSMVSTFFYGFLIYIIYSQVENKKLKYLLITLLSILIILICISRIYLGVHYLSDTIGGFLISLTYLMVLVLISKDLKKEKKV